MNRLRDELRIIPRIAWLLAVLEYVGFMSFCVFWLFEQPDFLRWAPFAKVPFAVLVPLPVAALILTIAYIHSDAKRRGMRHVLWTVLAIIIPNAIGIILYFLIREPLLGKCEKCAAPIKPTFSFCAKCGAAVSLACPSCRKPVEAGWTHCPSCGARLPQG